jgi:hypothetical protein
MSKLYKRRLVKISDVIFTAAIVAAALIVWFALGAAAGRGAVVVIRRDGAVVETLPLNRDTICEVDGAYRNVFVIREGAVRVAYTDCPNHSCERTGAIHTAGSAIVCAPNHVTATIEGEGVGVDAITGS